MKNGKNFTMSVIAYENISAFTTTFWFLSDSQYIYIFIYIFKNCEILNNVTFNFSFFKDIILRKKKLNESKN